MPDVQRFGCIAISTRAKDAASDSGQQKAQADQGCKRHGKPNGRLRECGSDRGMVRRCDLCLRHDEHRQ